MTTSYAGVTPPTRFVTDINSNGSVSTTAFTTASTTLGGWVASNCAVYLVIDLDSGTSTVNSVTSTYGGSWSRVTQLTQGAMRQEIWVNTGTTTNTGTITVTSSAATGLGLTAHVYANTDTTGPAVSVTQNGGTTTTAYSVTGPTLTEANAIVDIDTHIQAVGTTTVTIPSGVAPANLYTGLDRGVASSNLSALPGSSFGYFRSFTPDPPGISASAVALSGTFSVARTYINAIFVIRGMRVAMDDYTYQYTESGTLLNNQTGTPIFDIESVVGLSDINIDAESADYDGAHGGYTYAKFLSQKTIVLSGTMYATPFDESIVETFRGSFLPTGADKPFYFKHPGVSRRVMYCKPTSFKADIDQGRARGVMPFQLQVQASDPRMYADQKSVQLAAGTTIINSTGTMSSLPVIYFWVTAADIAAGTQFQFSRVASSNRSVSWTPTGLTAGLYKIDFAARTVTNVTLGTDRTNLVGVRSWWTIDPGTNTISMIRPAGTEPATLTYSEAYI